MHIPVCVLAADPAENQAFTDILNGQAGPLALVQPDEKPLVFLVCPSGNTSDAGLNPAVVLGEHGTLPEGARALPVPARLAEVLEALEEAASARSGFTQSRQYKGWALDPAHLTLRGPDEGVITLTDTEARLLACLFDAGGAEVRREELLQRVWGYRPGLETHTLETHIYRLRKKIEDDPASPSRIVTTEGGYHFAA